MIYKTRNVELFWQNKITECYCKNNLVFVSIFKNASSFYKNLFINNKWDVLEFKDINWEENHVFGFIQDPVVRYCKGLTEDLHKDLDLSGKIIPILSEKNCSVITFHTMPISIIVGDKMYDMTWFLLDSDTSSKQQLDEFCNQHGMFLDWNLNQITHSSDSEKINFFNNIRFLLGDGNHIFWRLFAKDIDLYNNVVRNHKNYNQS